MNIPSFRPCWAGAQSFLQRFWAYLFRDGGWAPPPLHAGRAGPVRAFCGECVMSPSLSLTLWLWKAVSCLRECLTHLRPYFSSLGCDSYYHNTGVIFYHEDVNAFHNEEEHSFNDSRRRPTSPSFPETTTCCSCDLTLGRAERNYLFYAT